MEKLLTVLSEVRADIDYRETDDLIDGGYFESIDIISCIAAIEDAFDIEIENEDAEKIATVGDAVEQIKNAVN